MTIPAINRRSWWRHARSAFRGMVYASAVFSFAIGASIAGGIVKALPASASCVGTRCDPAGTVELSGSAWLGGDGVNVYSNGANVGDDAGNDYVNNVLAGEEWQCVELVNRLYLTRDWISQNWYGNGDQLYGYAPSNLTKQPQGEIARLAPGDVISLGDATTGTGSDDGGHAAVVNSISGDTVNLVNQNTPDVYSSATLNNGTLTMDGWAGYYVIGAIDAPGSVPGGPVHSDQVIEVQKVNESGGIQQVYATTSSDVYQSWWDSTSGGIVTDHLISISQDNIVDSSEIDVPGGTQELYTATTNGIWETNWDSSESPTSTEIIPNLTGVEKIIARTEDDGGVTTFQLYIMTNHGVYQYWWNANSGGIQSYQIDGSSNPVDISFSSNDGTDQIYTAYPGYVEETWWNPGDTPQSDEVIGISQNNITAIDKIVEPDGTNVLAVATSSGEWDAEWGGSVPSMTYYYEVNNFSGSVAVARQQDADGTTQLIYLANDGQVQQYEWGATHGGGAAITISQDDIRAIVSDNYDGTDQVYTAAGNTVWETYYVSGSPETDMVVNIDEQQ